MVLAKHALWLWGVAGKTDEPEWLMVEQRRLLGVLVDNKLTFEPCLSEAIARGHAQFNDFFYAAESTGLLVLVAAAQVPLRIEPRVLYAAAFIATVVGAETKLNRLQQAWGRRLLGCHLGPMLRWPIVFAQCGWTMRLGTRCREKAIMMRARLCVLPEDHPAVVMFTVARGTLAPTWEASVSQLMQDPFLQEPIPGMLESCCVPPGLLQKARSCVDTRAQVLAVYKLNVVRPVLQQYDLRAYHQAADKHMPALGCTFKELHPYLCNMDLKLLQ